MMKFYVISTDMMKQALIHNKLRNLYEMKRKNHIHFFLTESCITRESRISD